MLQGLDGVSRPMACLLYGAWLRVLESCRLGAQDIDFATNQVVVRGKGDKDRVTMHPQGRPRATPEGRPRSASPGPNRRGRLGRATHRPEECYVK